MRQLLPILVLLALYVTYRIGHRRGDRRARYEIRGLLYPPPPGLSYFSWKGHQEARDERSAVVLDGPRDLDFFPASSDLRPWTPRLNPDDHLTCPGCHGGDFPDFDHYVELNGLQDGDLGEAFAAWLSGTTGWDGTAEESTSSS